ncbi:MAG TPA: carbohydrate porin [Bryobacteraceae bacterium]|nr:carbohydrate porin [Bryobacteraceae bacterium]
MEHQLTNIRKTATLCLLFGCLACSGSAQAPADPESSSWAQSPYMLGDWGGERTALERARIVFHFVSVNDLLVDGRSDVANWSRVRATMDVDFGKADLVPGLTFHITALWQGGGSMGSHIGSIAKPTSLLSADTTRLDSWSFEQALANNKLFIRAGQFAGLDFYGNQLDGGSYILEPLGYAIGNLFPADYESFDPAGTPAAEVRYVPSRHFIVKPAIFSGNRNPYHDDISGVNFKFKDSPVIAAEADYLVAPTPSSVNKTYPGTYRFGATTNPGPFANIVTGQRSSGNYLLYFMANQRVYRPEAGSDRGLDVNFAFDWTPDDITRNYSQITGGVRYHGLIPGRAKDTLAVGWSTAASAAW